VASRFVGGGRGLLAAETFAAGSRYVKREKKSGRCVWEVLFQRNKMAGSSCCMVEYAICGQVLIG